MRIFLITFQAVFTLLGIGLLGFWVIGRKRVPSTTLAFLSSLAIDIALPFLVIASLMTDFSPQEFPDWWQLPLWWLGFTVVALLLSLAASRLVKKEVRGEFTMSLFFQNGLFFPILVIIGLYGATNPYLSPLFLFMIFHPSLVFGTYHLFFRGKVQSEKLNWRKVVNPVMIATALGLVISLLAIKAYVPGFVLTILTMVGAMATPLFMLILGGNVYNDFMYKSEQPQSSNLAEIVKLVVFKNFMFPAIFLGLLIWLRPDYTLAFTIMLEAMVPPITAIPILTERSEGNRKVGSQFVVASFLVSIVSIPIFVYLFSLFFPA
jgi:malate permease and related proteins